MLRYAEVVDEIVEKQGLIFNVWFRGGVPTSRCTGIGDSGDKFRAVLSPGCVVDPVLLEFPDI